MHVLFLPPLLLVASGWILAVSPWAACSPMAGECEGEGEEDENLGAGSSHDAEPMLSRAQEASAQQQGVGGVWLWPSVCGTIPWWLTQSSPSGVLH